MGWELGDGAMDDSGSRRNQASSGTDRGNGSEGRTAERFLSVGLVVLLVLAVVEALAILHLHLETTRIVERMADLEVAEDLNLGVGTRALLLFTADDQVFSFQDLDRVRKQARNWLSSFCREHDVDPGTATMLRAVLERYLEDYASTRLREALGDFPGEDMELRYHKLLQWHVRTASELLEGELREQFRQELEQASREWGVLTPAHRE